MVHIAAETKTLDERAILEQVQPHVHDLETSVDRLLNRISNARIVMLGEASHGTHEYYVWRSRITQQLIRQLGFNIIAVEGDWPNCYSINRYIRHYDESGEEAADVLKQFKRWPTWMWSNWEIAALIRWLHDHNRNKPSNRRVGFYGLDLYSLWESLHAILDYLGERHSDTARLTEQALRCFEPYSTRDMPYASAGALVEENCETEVLELLRKIRLEAPTYDSDPEAPFNTEQNALTAMNAERYYRSMLSGSDESWNIRDRHMTETLKNLLAFHGREAKAVVWAHNTHVGDARATDMADRDLVNIGQLGRESWSADDVVLVGFGSYRGSVIAGSSWGSQMTSMRLPPARARSWEALLHQVDPADKLIITRDIASEPLNSIAVGHRAVGVVYKPEYEQYGNYVPTVIPERYDAFLYIDETRALHPLYTAPEKNMMPETYPWGI